jgi:hypothetical protein
MKMLAESPLAGDIADEEEQATLVEAEVIVQIAAGFPCRDHGGRNVDSGIAVQEVGARQRRGLDPARRFELAGNARRRFALDLNRFARAPSSGVSPRSSVSTSSTPNSSMRPTAGVRGVEERRWARKAANATAAGSTTPTTISSAALRGFQRGVTYTSHPPSSEEEHRLEPRRPVRPAQQRVVVEILEQLRVDFAAGHALDRRECSGIRAGRVR